MNPRAVFFLILFVVGCGAVVVEGLPPKAETATEPNSHGKGDAEAAKEPNQKDPVDEKKEEPEVESHVTVRCVPAQKRAFAVTVDGLGKTEALPESLGPLTAVVEGHVHKLLVNLGDLVAAGQPIIELDTTIARTLLAEKIANRDSLKAALRLLTSKPRDAECRVAELAIEQAKVAIDRARAVVDHLKPLIARQEVSPQQFFDAEQALKQAQLLRDTAVAQLKLLKLGPRPEAIAEAETKIAIAEEAITNTQATLALHTLRAPIGGVVDSLTCHPGQTLTIGTPVGEVVDTRRLFVTVYFPGRSARRLLNGMSARIDVAEGEQPTSAGSSSSGPNETGMTGKVAFIGRVADMQTGNFPVRVLIENAAARLRVGQVVKTIVTLRNEEPAIAVPEAALFDQGEGPLLAVVRDEKLKLLHPELGTAEGGFVVVTKTDLREGEMVAVEGAYNVPDGTSATVEAAKPAAGESEEKAPPADDAPAVSSAKEQSTAKPGESK
jgi:HlyD family secretion protein